eukprot:jgi/Mesvir1/6450/Mv19529-RA.1
MTHPVLRDVRVLLAKVSSALGIEDATGDCGRLHGCAGRDVLNDKAEFLESISAIRVVVEQYRAWKVVDPSIVNRYLALQRDLSAVSQQVSRFHAQLREATAEDQKPQSIADGSTVRGAEVNALQKLADSLLPLVRSHDWRLEERQAATVTLTADNTRLTIHVAEDGAAGRSSHRSSSIQASWFFRAVKGAAQLSAEMDETDPVDRSPVTLANALEWVLDAEMSHAATQLVAQGQHDELVRLMRGAVVLADMAPGKHGRHRLASLERQLTPLVSFTPGGPPSHATAPTPEVERDAAANNEPWAERLASLHPGSGVLILAYYRSCGGEALTPGASRSAAQGRHDGTGAAAATGGAFPSSACVSSVDSSVGQLQLWEDRLADAVLSLAMEEGPDAAWRTQGGGGYDCDTPNGQGVVTCARSQEASGVGGAAAGTTAPFFRAFVTCEDDLTSGADASTVVMGRTDPPPGADGTVVAVTPAVPGMDPPPGSMVQGGVPNPVPDTPMSAVSSSGGASLWHRPPLPLPSPSRKSQLVMVRLRPPVVMTANALTQILALGPAPSRGVAGGTPHAPRLPVLLPLRPEFASFWELLFGGDALGGSARGGGGGLSAGTRCGGTDGVRVESLVPVRRGVHHLYSCVLEGAPSCPRGVVVSHLPVSSAHQLVPTLRTLQQVLLFNELLRSCFPGEGGGSGAVGPSRTHARKRAREELPTKGVGRGVTLDPRQLPEGADASGDVACGSVHSFEIVAHAHEAILVYFCLPGADLMGMACLHIRVFPGGHLRAALFAPGHGGCGGVPPPTPGVALAGTATGAGAPHGQSSSSAGKDVSEDDGSLGEVVGSGSVPGVGSGCIGACGFMDPPHTPLRLCSDLYATRLLTVSRSIPRSLYLIINKITSQAASTKA